ncbi:MAG: hypothetical protein PF503_15295 [Desulfobacula sp.]|jgi:hypothetical protein|nr:hypothetical protein [Desulfobacula sp.]
MRKKANIDDSIPAIIPNEMSSKEFRQNWARLIQKVYGADYVYHTTSEFYFRQAFCPTGGNRQK